MYVTAFTDGSCYYKTKLGGYGVYIKNGEEETFFQKGFENTTISRMELRGVIVALQKIVDKNSLVKIYCDSEYVVKSITEMRLWYWEKIDWFGVKNSDLMKLFLCEISKFKFRPELIHVKGHQKDLSNDLVYGNNVADLLADYKQFQEREYDKY